MKTAMQEVLNLVEQMFNNADALKLELPASLLNDVINIITQEGIQKEKKQAIDLIKETAMFMGASIIDIEISKMEFEDIYNNYYKNK